MKTGIELINDERNEQIDKHVRALEYDASFNTDCQLGTAACTLAYEEIEALPIFPPTNWDEDLWAKMIAKPYKERLIIAGALIAAEIDRVNANK